MVILTEKNLIFTSSLHNLSQSHSINLYYPNPRKLYYNSFKNETVVNTKKSVEVYNFDENTMKIKLKRLIILNKDEEVFSIGEDRVGKCLILYGRVFQYGLKGLIIKNIQ